MAWKKYGPNKFWMLFVLMPTISFFLAFLIFQGIEKTKREGIDNKKLAIEHPLRSDVVYSVERYGTLCVPEDGGPEIWVSISDIVALPKKSQFILKSGSDNWDDAFTIVKRGDE